MGALYKGLIYMGQHIGPAQWHASLHERKTSNDLCKLDRVGHVGYLTAKQLSSKEILWPQHIEDEYFSVTDNDASKSAARLLNGAGINATDIYNFYSYACIRRVSDRDALKKISDRVDGYLIEHELPKYYVNDKGDRSSLFKKCGLIAKDVMSELVINNLKTYKNEIVKFENLTEVNICFASGGDFILPSRPQVSKSEILLSLSSKCFMQFVFASDKQNNYNINHISARSEIVSKINTKIAVGCEYICCPENIDEKRFKSRKLKYIRAMNKT